MPSRSKRLSALFVSLISGAIKEVKFTRLFILSSKVIVTRPLLVIEVIFEFTVLGISIS